MPNGVTVFKFSGDAMARIEPQTHAQFFGGASARKHDAIVHVAYYGTKLLGAFKQAAAAEAAILREAEARGHHARH